MSQSFQDLFAQYLNLNPSFEELDSLLRDVGEGEEAKVVYHKWIKALEELLSSKPEESELRVTVIRLKNVFQWKDIKQKELAQKLIELDPCDETFLLIMKKLPAFEQELLPQIKDEKNRLRYLMAKCLK